jgi:hypothetical protein
MGGFNPFGPSTIGVGGIAFSLGTARIGVKAINKTGSSIAKNKVVALVGLDTTTKLPKMVLASATDPSHTNLFITDYAVSNGASANVYKGLMSAANLDTSGATAAGDAVYLSATAGAFTSTAPIDSAGGINPVGNVIVKSATVGTVLFNLLGEQPRAAGVLVSRQRISTANVNTGVTLIAAPGAGYKLRLVDCIAIAIGGAAATVTTVDILGTQAASGVKLVAYAQASLTQSTVLRPGVAGAAVLADGASFAACDANTAITIGKTGASLATATSIDVILSYAVDPV